MNITKTKLGTNSLNLPIESPDLKRSELAKIISQCEKIPFFGPIETDGMQRNIVFAISDTCIEAGVKSYLILRPGFRCDGPVQS